LRTALFWVITLQVVVIPCRRFGKTSVPCSMVHKILDPWRWER